MDPEARQLGCSKCRFAIGGCGRCRQPSFRPRSARPIRFSDRDKRPERSDCIVPPAKKPRLVSPPHGEAGYRERPLATGDDMAARSEDCSARGTAVGPCNDPAGGGLQDSSAAANSMAALHVLPQAKCAPFLGPDLDEESCPELPDTSTKKVCGMIMLGRGSISKPYCLLATVLFSRPCRE